MSRVATLICALPLLTTGCAPTSELPVHGWTSDADGFHTNSWWIDTGEAVVVFDAQFTPALAQALVQDIQSQTDSPITHVVVTHPNPDKFNGAPVFAALGAQVVASQATVDAMAPVHDYKRAYFEGVGMFEPGTYPDLAHVDVVFQDRLLLDVPGAPEPIALQVLEHGGVASTQTIARFQDAVFVGDLVAVDTHAWLEGGIVDGAAQPDLVAWDAALSQVLELVGADATLFPGRGPATPAGPALRTQQAYLSTAHDTVRAQLALHAEPVAVLEGPDAGAFYADVADALAGAYPNHAHPYLVEYGVYGLAWALALD